MKVYVKTLHAKDTDFAINVNSKDTTINLKERIGEALGLSLDAVRLLHKGHPLSNPQASLESYGIEDGSRINVVYCPPADMNNTAVSKALYSILRDSCPSNALPMIVEQYQTSLARKVKNFSLEELERYAKFRNQRGS